ncbi:RHS repeat domain-containing protein [Niabella drilacis]|nr:RHS repeat-associated core domain-containing protein [Niabella drilacis]
MNAGFKEYSGSSYTASGSFNSRMGDGNPGNPESAYDYNGNIKAMTQQGLAGSSSLLMDQLVYSYQPGSNKLAKVTDQAGNTRSYQLGDFNDGTNSGDDYAYDVNGNLTKDENKNISGITYNILNLPEQISVTGKGTIVYQYDASGNKLGKTVSEGSTQKITTYVGGMIFENDVLQHVAMEEGRFRPNGSIFTADYFLKDHLGNVRSMINENRTLLEETHYYPFGLTMKGISYQNTTTSLQNKRKFNGYEETAELGVNLYESIYRTHDPQIGRFWQMDPKPTDSISLYAFGYNNPIRYNDPLGDTAILGINNRSALGLGHQVLIYQDKDKNWFVYSMGAAKDEKGADMVSGRTGSGEVTITALTAENFKGLPEGVLTSGQITEFLAGNKLGNANISDPVVLATTQKQDEMIAANAIQSQADFANGKEKYNLYKNNSTHNTMKVLNTNTKLNLPVTGGPRSTHAQVKEAIKVRNMTPEQRAVYNKQQNDYTEKLKADALMNFN